MTTDNDRLTDEARIRELIEERVGAIRAGDVDALMRSHAPEVVMFDALDPLRYVGAEGSESAPRSGSLGIKAPSTTRCTT